MNLLGQMVPILPELILSAGILIYIVLELIVGERREGILSFLALLVYGAALAPFAMGYVSFTAAPTHLFYGQIQVDGMAAFFRLLLLLVGASAVLIAHGNPELRAFQKGEYQLLLMGAVLGGMFMSLSASVVMIYLSVEFVSLLSYVLAAARIREAKSFEAAIKYILFGAVASGIMLFGLSFLSGLGGSTDISLLGEKLFQGGNNAQRYLLLGSVAFVMVGVGYKIAAVPFHAWCPDVYEGAPTPVTTFFSVGPKVAGFALLIRFFAALYEGTTPALNASILVGASAVSVLTMTLGNLAALRQNNVKRMLAYSSIAHAGYALAAFSAFTTLANQAILFYLFAYFFMNTGAFLTLMVVSGESGKMDISLFNGLAYRGRSGAFWAVLMSIFLFSLTGLPPFMGFIGKYYLFAALLERQIYWLAIAAVLNSVVSLYYYARILRAMFFVFGKSDVSAVHMAPAVHLSLLGALLGAITIFLGIFPGYLPIL